MPTLLAKELRDKNFSGGSIRVEIDDRDLRGGEKYWGWVKKGIPLTIEIGPRDLENGTVFVGRRDHGSKREGMGRQALIDGISTLLEDMQSNLFARALTFREENTVTIDSKEELYAYFTPQNKSKPEIHGGFALVHWDRDSQWEEQLKNDLKVTVRCIPEEPGETGTCIFSGNESPGRVVLAKSY